MKRLLLLLAVFILCISAVSAVETTAYFFHGDGCPHCTQMIEFLDIMEDKYPDLTVKTYETYYSPGNHDLFEHVSKKYNTTIQGVPTLFINDTIVVGFDFNMVYAIEETIVACVDSGCDSPDDVISAEFKAIAGAYVPLSDLHEEDSGMAKFIFILFVLLIIGSAVVIVFLSRQTKKKK